MITNNSKMLRPQSAIVKIGWQIACLTFLVICCNVVVRAQDALSTTNEDRLKRLAQLADALQRVKVEQQSSTGDRTADGRRFSKSSKLNMRFLIAVADLTENKKDAICAFPVQVSGFTSDIDSSRKIDNQKTGSDMQRAEVKISGLIGSAKPKVTIQLAPLNHGSEFPADQIARDKIHDLVRFFFPEAEIDGVQRFFEKEIQIQNATKESIKVWIFGRSWVKKTPAKTAGITTPILTDKNSTDSLEAAMDWAWIPGNPETAKPIEIQLAAGQSKRVMVGEQPLTANRILYWAESETGERWNDRQSDPIWTVDPDPKDSNKRTYHANKIALFTHKIEAQPGPKLLTERLLEMKNDTDKPIEVEMRYRTQTDRGFVWRNSQFTVPAKQAVRPTDSAGAYIRSSRIQFVGKSEDRQYLKYQSNPLWLVDDIAGRRAYKAEKIGLYRYTFQSATQSANVAVDSAEVKIGTKTIAKVKRNDKFEILATEKDWAQVSVTVNGEKQNGWIKKSNLIFDKDDIAGPPDASRKSLRILTDDAELKQGTTTLARLKRGESYDVLEKSGKWLRIEATVGGNRIHGWVQESKVKLSQ